MCDCITIFIHSITINLWYREKIILIIKIKVRNIFKNMFKENEKLKFQDV